MKKQHELRYNLTKLQSEHQDVERMILEEYEKEHPDQLMIQRYKKRKLQIKEQIIKIESELLPDIIA